MGSSIGLMLMQVALGVMSVTWVSDSTYQRGLDLLLNTYNFLDLTPLGRHEEDAPGQSWIRHHDKYPA